MDQLDINSAVGQFVLRFLQESNQIEEVAAHEDDLRMAWQARLGHPGAALLALRLAEARQPISIERLCLWQATITRDQRPRGHWIDEGDIGRLRSRPMRMIGRPPFANPAEIDPQLRALLDHVNAGLEKPAGDDPLGLAARAHWQFEIIHPFGDGNGRTGRLLALYMLRAARVRPVLFTAGDKWSVYYRAFERSGPERMVSYFQDHQAASDPWGRIEPPGPF